MSGMGRREFVALLGGAAAAWPIAARAQQGERVRRIGVLMFTAASDPYGRKSVKAFQEGLQELGWMEGRNIQIEIRWAPNVESLQRLAKELVTLQPDVIVAPTTSATRSILEQTRTIPLIFVVANDPVGSAGHRFPPKHLDGSGSCRPGGFWGFAALNAGDRPHLLGPFTTALVWMPVVKSVRRPSGAKVVRV